MKKELIKARNKLLVYSLIIATGVCYGSCSNSKNISDDNTKVESEEEMPFVKIKKEKRNEYGR